MISNKNRRCIPTQTFVFGFVGMFHTLVGVCMLYDVCITVLILGTDRNLAQSGHAVRQHLQQQQQQLVVMYENTFPVVCMSGITQKLGLIYLCPSASPRGINISPLVSV